MFDLVGVMDLVEDEEGEMGREREGGGGGVREGTKLSREAVGGGANATGMGRPWLRLGRVAGSEGVFNASWDAILAGGLGNISTMGLMIFSKKVASYTELRLFGKPVEASRVASEAVE